MNKIKIVGILSWFMLGALSALSAQELPVDIERTQQLRVMDQGVELMNQGKFTDADDFFLRVLESVEVVPADLCFYFGKNSYHLQKYKQSIDWLNKYMELKGTTGRFFDQAAEYLKLAKADHKALSEDSPPAITQRPRSAKPAVVDCGENPYVRCPVCQGEGVIVKPGKLGSLVYKTCPYSDESGRMTCPDYQKYLRGELRPSVAENGQ